MSHFYIWRDRYRQDGLAGLRDGPRGPQHHPFTTPAHIVAIVALSQDVPAVSLGSFVGEGSLPMEMIPLMEKAAFPHKRWKAYDASVQSLHTPARYWKAPWPRNHRGLLAPVRCSDRIRHTLAKLCATAWSRIRRQ
jgi:hypothetical protein